MRDEVRGPLILCIGNRYRQDDALGPLAADRLSALGLPTLELSGEGAGLIEAWSGGGLVLVVDALQSGAPPGTLRRIDAVQEPLPAGLFRYSSHRFGLAEAVETARALNRLPDRLIIHGVEGAVFGFGETLTPAVAAVFDSLIEAVAADLTASAR